MRTKISCGLLLALVLAIMPLDIMAESEAAIWLRVESQTETLFNDMALPIQAGMTVLDVLLSQADLMVETDGAWLVSINGINGIEGGDNLAWMFAVNDEISVLSVDEHVLEAGDHVVVYLLDWQRASYAFFTPSLVEVLAGEEVTLQLSVFHFGTGVSAIEDIAQIIIESDAPTDRMLRHTDENGQITLSFPHAGRYYVSAAVYEDGHHFISRPLSVWMVGPEIVAEVGMPPQQLEPPPGVAVTPMGWGVNVDNGDIWFVDRTIRPIPAPLRIWVEGESVILVPFRAVVEELIGGQVSWDGETRTVTAAFGERQMSFQIDGFAGGAPVMVIEDRTFVPLQYIMDNLLN